MPICTDQGCLQAGIEQSVKLFMKGDRLCKMCQACRDRKNAFKHAVCHAKKINLTWWPKIKGKRREQLIDWLNKNLALYKTSLKAVPSPFSRIAPPSPSPWPQPVPKEARGEWIKIE